MVEGRGGKHHLGADGDVWAAGWLLEGQGTEQWFPQGPGTNFGARFSLPTLQLQQLGPSQQNEPSCSSEAEEQRKTQEGTKKPCLCAWLVVEGELGVL